MDTLVLEGVTLSLQVQLVVQMPVNLLGLPILPEEPPENTHSGHPCLLHTGSGVGSTLPLTRSRVTSLTTLSSKPVSKLRLKSSWLKVKGKTGSGETHLQLLARFKVFGLLDMSNKLNGCLVATLIKSESSKQAFQLVH